MSQEKKTEILSNGDGEASPSNVISLAERRKLKEQMATSENVGSADPSPEHPPKAQQAASIKPTLPTLSALAAFALLVTIMNFSIFDRAPDVQNSQLSSLASDEDLGRGPASIQRPGAGFEPSLGQRDEGLEKKLAQKLAEPRTRGPASLGTQPSLEQRLRYEFFENKYALGFESGKLHSVRFIPTSGFDASPKYIEDKEQFLMDYRGLFPVDFFEPVRLERDIASSDGEISETFVLIGDNSTPSGRVLFSMDKFGRLLEMKVEVR